MRVVVVPNINQRRRISRRAIQAVVKQIAEQFAPNKIILFGSSLTASRVPKVTLTCWW